jgi:hypothetical protein
MAIIALLISILLPGLSRAREAAKRSVCLTNLKSISTSSHIYATDDDNNQSIPVHHKFVCGAAPGHPAGVSCPQPYNNATTRLWVGAYEWGGKAGVGIKQSHIIPGATGVHRSRYGTKAGFGPASRPLNAYIYKGGFTDYLRTNSLDGMVLDTQMDLQQFRCPADDGPGSLPANSHSLSWINEKDSSYDHFGTSYTANIFMTFVAWSPSSNPMRIAQPVMSNSPYLRPSSRVVTPSRTIYYEENLGRFAWAAAPDPCPTAAGLNIGTKGIKGWHGKNWAFTRGFMDAHAEYQTVVERWQSPVDGVPQNDYHYRWERLTSYPSLPVDAPGPLPSDWNKIKCSVVRGDGWQKDTLPDQPIKTHIASHAFDSYSRVELAEAIEP